MQLRTSAGCCVAELPLAVFDTGGDAPTRMYQHGYCSHAHTTSSQDALLPASCAAQALHLTGCMQIALRGRISRGG